MKINTSSPIYVIAFTAVITIVFTGAIMILQVATAGIVERNEQLLRQKALVELFELGDVNAMSDQQVIDAYGKGVSTGQEVVDPQTGMRFVPLMGRKDDKDLGYAVPVAGVGFWAEIRGYVRISPDLERIEGVVFTEQAETPGLGARITEQSWRQSFKGLRARPSDDGGQKLIYIGGGQPGGEGDVRYERYVDSITGATQTSIAVENFLNEDIAAFMRAMEEGSPSTRLGAGSSE